MRVKYPMENFFSNHIWKITGCKQDVWIPENSSTGWWNSLLYSSDSVSSKDPQNSVFGREGKCWTFRKSRNSLGSSSFSRMTACESRKQLRKWSLLDNQSNTLFWKVITIHQSSYQHYYSKVKWEWCLFHPPRIQANTHAIRCQQMLHFIYSFT